MSKNSDGPVVGSGAASSAPPMSIYMRVLMIKADIEDVPVSGPASDIALALNRLADVDRGLRKLRGELMKALVAASAQKPLEGV